ncbi:protein sprint [Teleopsis dalmanni]|uniref:protein sprint n=1 Tax=Teleopsis dalmanni TaxID=139649 RepID=UPI0018CE890F|nr:protein sprint [Teleopsis dalmanni]
MGRLFQYNRFGTTNPEHRRENPTSSNSKTKENREVRKYPAYSELYTEYHNTTIPTTSTTAAATVTVKSMDLAIKKYQQWSSKFLPTATTNLDVSQASCNSSPTATTTYSCTVSSGYYTQNTTGECYGQEHDREVLVSSTKRPKVYDCMKDFLRKKFFQLNNSHSSNSNCNSDSNNTTNKQPNDNVKTVVSDTDEEDVTSDYDELDMLDSSYNADEEEEADATDCSCSCSSNSDEEACAPHIPKLSTQKSSNSPQKSALSLNCWQSNNCSSTETEESAAQTDESDAGISDCCQLISEKSPKRRSPKKSPTKYQQYRYNIDDDDLPELMESNWYQPRITTKAALERLQLATPGTFLVRRKSRTFELCLRVETKVKFFTVISTDDNYKLKGAKKEFTTLKALVTHHSVMAEQLPVTLRLPRTKQQLGRCADDFDTFESLQILGILQNLQTKSMEFA